MGSTFYGRNGTCFDVNLAGGMWLDTFTRCLWDKIGIPEPLSNEDALLVSRMLRNWVAFHERDPEGKGSIWKAFNIEFAPEFTEWALKVAHFFETSGGLITSEEWDEKFEDLM